MSDEQDRIKNVSDGAMAYMAALGFLPGTAPSKSEVRLWDRLAVRAMRMVYERQSKTMLGSDNAQLVANEAYDLADAMMRERSKRRRSWRDS